MACNNPFTTERGEELLCEKPLGHFSHHGSGDWEWWEVGEEIKSDRSLTSIVSSSAKMTEWRVQSRIQKHMASAAAREFDLLKSWREEWILTREHWKWAKAQTVK